jgi:hypothetical protein
MTNEKNRRSPLTKDAEDEIRVLKDEAAALIIAYDQLLLDFKLLKSQSKIMKEEQHPKSQNNTLASNNESQGMLQEVNRTQGPVVLPHKKRLTN